MLNLFGERMGVRWTGKILRLPVREKSKLSVPKLCLRKLIGVPSQQLLSTFIFQVCGPATHSSELSDSGTHFRPECEQNYLPPTNFCTAQFMLRSLTQKLYFITKNLCSSTKLTTMAARVLPLDTSSISFPSSISSSEPPIITCPDTDSALRTAAHALTDLSSIVAFPTETVYGLGANALSSTAVQRIFTAKGRPADNPLIVHVSSLPMLQRLLPDDYKIPAHYDALIRAFWPGALTLLFPANAAVVPSIVTAGRETVGVRMPAHPAARALIAIADTPLAAPSANTSGKPSPTRAAHVLADLGAPLDDPLAKPRVELILDGGACAIGLESTVVDGLCSDGNLRVLRPGGVTVEDLERVMATLEGEIPKVLVHKRDYADEELESAPTTPGMKYRHYSPSVPVVLLMTKSSPPTNTLSISISELFAKYSSMKKVGLLVPSDSGLQKHITPGFPLAHYALGTQNDPAMSSARLFDGLLTLEAEGVEVILVEEIRDEREGLAFMNRTRKAAGEQIYVHE